MADTKITALTALTAADPANDVIPIVDVSDTTMAASGTTKKISVNNILSSSPTASGALTVTGLVTAGSATITGAATVGTTLGVTGASTLASVGVTGAATVGTTLGVTGNITGSGADPNFNNGSLNLFLSGGTTGDPAISFARYGSASLNNRGAKIQYVYRVASAQESGSLAFYSNPDSAGTGSLVERMRIDYSGDVNISTGNVVMATSGKGIDFSATANSSGTMTSELLNDYEEGTFTPTVAGATTTGVGVYTQQAGFYTKVGNLVTVSVFLGWTAHTGTGNMYFGGLPFTTSSSANSYGAASITYVNNITLTASNVLTLLIPPSQVYFESYQYPVGGGTTTNVPIDVVGSIIYTATYRV